MLSLSHDKVRGKVRGNAAIGTIALMYINVKPRDARMVGHACFRVRHTDSTLLTHEDSAGLKSRCSLDLGLLSAIRLTDPSWSRDLHAVRPHVCVCHPRYWCYQRKAQIAWLRRNVSQSDVRRSKR